MFSLYVLGFCCFFHRLAPSRCTHREHQYFGNIKNVNENNDFHFIVAWPANRPFNKSWYCWVPGGRERRARLTQRQIPLRSSMTSGDGNCYFWKVQKFPGFSCFRSLDTMRLSRGFVFLLRNLLLRIKLRFPLFIKLIISSAKGKELDLPSRNNFNLLLQLFHLAERKKAIKKVCFDARTVKFLRPLRGAFMRRDILNWNQLSSLPFNLAMISLSARLCLCCDNKI